MEACASVSDIPKDVDVFEAFGAHVETPKGVTAESLYRVYRVSREDTVRTLNVHCGVSPA